MNQDATSDLPGAVIRITDYGAIPDSGQDAGPAVARAMEAVRWLGRPAVLEFPQGQYDFFQDQAVKAPYYISNTASEEEQPDVTKSIGLFLHGLKQVTVEGNGSLFVFHGKITMFVLDACENITIRNVDVDYASPTIAEMTVESIGEKYIETRVHPDSRYTLDGDGFHWTGEGWRFRDGPAQQFHPRDNRTWRIPNPISAAARVEERSPGRLRLHYAAIPDVSIGDVLQMRDGIRDQAGAFMHRCRNIVWSRVGMHYMHGLGIVGQYSENLTFREMNLSPRQSTGRTAAAFADFLHLSGNRGRIEIADCRFEGAHDDAINIHGTHLRIMEQIGPKQIRVRFMHAQSYGFDAFFPGDDIDFVRAATLTVYASGRVERVTRINPREILLTLESAINQPVMPTDVVENVTWTPEVRIRRNTFARIPTRGILVTTRRPVVIEQNRFERMEMSGILVADDASSWYESGMVNDLMIRDNHFIECGNGGHPVIRIEPEVQEKGNGQAVHRHIRIEGNTFDSLGEVLEAKYVDQLTFAANTIRRSERMPASSEKEDAESFITLQNCMNTRIKDNWLR